MSWKDRLEAWLQPFDTLWERLRLHLRARFRRSKLPAIQVSVYRGYAGPGQLWLKGRVLEDRLILVREEDTTWRNVVNTYKRFSSREIWGAELEIELADRIFPVLTDRNGYFELSTSCLPPLPQADSGWLSAQVRLIRTPWVSLDRSVPAELMMPPPGTFGVISDIDDTILRTGVASRLMWRAIYRTILKNARSRIIFRETIAFYQAIAQQQDPATPFFYVSNTPWNLYDVIDELLQLHQFPRGPLLLRDLGDPTRLQSSGYRGHKYESIAQIFDTYPHLNFVLIGDSGEHDTDIYLELHKDYPDRVRAIYIRDVQHLTRTQRVSNLIKDCDHPEIFLLKDFEEAVAHAARLGILDIDIYHALQ